MIITATNSFAADFKVVSEGDKQGLADGEGNIVIPVIYDHLGWSDDSDQLVDDVIGFSEGNKWGLINVKNERLTDPMYIDLYPTLNGFLIASRESAYAGDLRFGVLNAKGKAQLGFQYNSLRPRGNHLIAGQQIDNVMRWGVLDYQEQTVIPLQYDGIEIRHLNFVVYENEKAALFQPTGQQLSQFIYDDISELGSYTLVSDHIGKVGLLDHLGRRLIETAYKSIRLAGDSLVAIRTFPKWELIVPGEGAVEEFYFDTIHPVNHGIFRISTNGREAIINIAGEYLLEGNNWNISVPDEQFVLVSENGKHGVLQEGGIELLPVKYDSIYYSGKHFYVMTRENDQSKWQIYSTFGSLISSSNFQALYPMSEDMIPTKKHDYWGYIDFSGHIVIDYKYDNAWPFVDGRAKVNYLGNQGIINSAGEWVIYPNHAEVTIVNKDLFINHAGNRYDLLDGREKIIYQTYNQLEPHSFGLVEKTDGGKLGLINQQGESILPPAYHFISELSGNQVYVLRKEDEYGVIDKEGNFVLALTKEYQAIGGLSEGFLSVKKDQRYGFIDFEGNLRIANRYEEVSEFSEGMAAVKLLDKWGYIDRLERLRIQPRYEIAEKFERGIARVRRDGKYGIIDMEGNEVLPPVYDELLRNELNSFVVVKDGRFGLANFKGELLIPPKFQKLEENDNGLLLVKQRGKFGVIEKNGINVIPIVYDDILYDHINGYYLGKRSSEEENRSVR